MTKKKRTTSKRKKSTQKSTPQARVERRFVPLLAIFAVVVAVVAGLSFYTAFAKTTIVVSGNSEAREEVFEFELDELDASVSETSVEHSFDYSDFEGVDPVPGVATGTVTIINNYSADQPLVETTRLLSDSGVLFRTSETVTVPSGGSVDVEVYADEEGAAGNIDPDRFEIVALWDGLKDNIYAESSESMSGGLVFSATVSEGDIDAATEQANEEVRMQAFEQFAAEGVLNTTSLSSQEIALTIESQEFDAEVGDTVDGLTVSTTAQAVATDVTKGAVVDAIEEQTGVRVKPERVEYVVDGESGSYMITATAMIDYSFDNADFLNRDKLVGRTENEIVQYITSFDQVDSVTVHFNPFWMRTAPLNPDSIVIQVTE